MGKVLMGVGLVVLVLMLAAVILTLPTYYLWNWLMPMLFGLRELTLGQALGVTLLANILFKGGGGTQSAKK